MTKQARKCLTPLRANGAKSACNKTTDLPELSDLPTSRKYSSQPLPLHCSKVLAARSAAVRVGSWRSVVSLQDLAVPEVTAPVLSHGLSALVGRCLALSDRCSISTSHPTACSAAPGVRWSNRAVCQLLLYFLSINQSFFYCIHLCFPFFCHLCPPTSG